MPDFREIKKHFDYVATIQVQAFQILMDRLAYMESELEELQHRMDEWSESRLFVLRRCMDQESPYKYDF